VISNAVAVKDWLSNNFREIKLKAVQKAPQTWKLLSFQP